MMCDGVTGSSQALQCPLGGPGIRTPYSVGGRLQGGLGESSGSHRFTVTTHVLQETWGSQL